MKVRFEACLAAAIAGACAPAVAVAAPLPMTPAISGAVVNQDPYPERRISFPGGVVGLPDLTYTAVQGYRPLKLDLYLPPAAANAKGPRPVVVFIHGGGWVGGTPRTTGAFENWPGVLASLAAKGYVVASLSYRFSREAPSPAAIQDVKAGIRWLRANAGRYNIDTHRFLSWGPSAGGQLAALAAVSCGVTALLPTPPARSAAARPEVVESGSAAPPAESECVQGAVGWYGVYDFAALTQSPGAAPAASNPFLGCAATCGPEQLRQPSPITYVDRNDPPMLLIHGESDHVVPVAQAQQFHAALQAAGVKSELVLLPGIDHSWIGRTPEATRTASIEALRRTFDFIDATIGDR